MHKSSGRGEGEASILVVDDDVDAQQLLADLLRRHGYDVVARDNGAEALAYLREAPAPRLILLDLQMPVMDGYELNEKLVADQELARVPVVLMTDVRSIDHARIAPVAILPKPLRVQMLMSILEQHG